MAFPLTFVLLVGALLIEQTFRVSYSEGIPGILAPIAVVVYGFPGNLILLTALTLLIRSPQRVWWGALALNVLTITAWAINYAAYP
jgi:hypothetical protein